jgi:hypothetical protein
MSEVSREYYGSYSVDDEDQLQPSDTLDGRGVASPRRVTEGPHSDENPDVRRPA